jgi:hypothetical protein
MAGGKHVSQTAVDVASWHNARAQLGVFKGTWHNARAQLGVFKGTETAALPTLGIEGRFSAALQT